MKLLSSDELEALVVKVAEANDAEPTDDSPNAVAAQTLYSMASRILLLEAELAKFHECIDSNGCYDDCAHLHVKDSKGVRFTYAHHGEPMRTVYHKEGE
jgi:hypothetical protein